MPRRLSDGRLDTFPPGSNSDRQASIEATLEKWSSDHASLSKAHSNPVCATPQNGGVPSWRKRSWRGLGLDDKSRSRALSRVSGAASAKVANLPFRLAQIFHPLPSASELDITWVGTDATDEVNCTLSGYTLINARVRDMPSRKVSLCGKTNPLTVAKCLSSTGKSNSGDNCPNTSTANSLN